MLECCHSIPDWSHSFRFVLMQGQVWKSMTPMSGALKGSSSDCQHSWYLRICLKCKFSGPTQCLGEGPCHLCKVVMQVKDAEPMHSPGMVIWVYSPGTQEAEARGLWFEDSLGYIMWNCLKIDRQRDNFEQRTFHVTLCLSDDLESPGLMCFSCLLSISTLGTRIQYYCQPNFVNDKMRLQEIQY